MVADDAGCPHEVCIDRDNTMVLFRNLHKTATYAEEAWLSCGVKDAGQ